MRRLFFILLLLVFTLASFGQLLPFKKYTEKDGLNSKNVYAVVRDDRGLLWVGTSFGINWFDGTHFYQPNVPKKVNQLYVQRFYKDEQGTIWVLTFYNGFYKFQNDHFTQYLLDTNYSEVNKNNVMDMTEIDSAHYILATDDGVYLFNGKTFNRIDSKNLKGQIASVAYTKNYLLVGNGNGLYCYNYRAHWKLTAKWLQGIGVNRILIHDNHIWIATETGLYYFDHFDFNGNNQPSAVYLKNKQVPDVTVNASGEVWFSGNNRLYKISANQIIGYNSATGLSSLPVQIYFDQQNTGWLSTYDGLFKLSEEYYNFRSELHDPASFVKADGKVWVSYPNGFSDLSGTFSYHFPDGVKAGYTRIYYADKSKKFWVVNESGIYLLKGKKLQKKFSLQCSALYEDNDEITWIATNDGKLFTVRNEQLQPIQYSSFFNDFIATIDKDPNGFLWLGFRTSGILKCSIENNVLKTIREVSSKTGFVDMRIRSCEEDGKGNILFGTRTNGLFAFSLYSNQSWHIANATALNAPWIVSMDASDSDVYLASNNGLYVLKAQTDYSNPKINHISFSNDEILKQINCVFVNGREVLVGCNGLIQFFPDKYQKDTTPPPVFITQVNVNDKTDSSWKPYGLQQNKLQLPYNTNVVAFEFSGVHLKDEDELHYRYKLEGQDKNWSAVTNRNFVSYNLPPGNYCFLVEAQNANGKWSTAPASYSFSIAQPFWTTWWFIAIIISAVIVLAYLIYRYRLQQAVKFERLRYKISTDLHDDIGSTLSSISILSEMALNENNRKQNEVMVAEIKENSLDLMEKMDDIVWSINPKNDSLGSLLLRIKRFSSKLFEAKDIDYSIDIDKAVTDVKLPMEYRQHIYLILKEAINNLVKYSQAERAAIEMNCIHSILKIRVSDNGKGFDLNAANSGNGIISMKSRAALMKADLKIETNRGEGTTIRLEVKIK